MRTTPAHDNVLDFNALLHPGTVFSHPRDLVADPALSLSEKRATLASWAYDASAIASCPVLRAPDGLMAPVRIDEILEALRAGWKRLAQSANRRADAAAVGRAPGRGLTG